MFDDSHEETVRMWPTAYCRECNRPFPQQESWAKKCLICFKSDRDYAVLKGDLCFLWAQMEIQQLQQELSRLHGMSRTPAATSLKEVLTPKLIRDLLNLSHPDKHKNSPKSTAVTQQLLEIRASMKDK